MYSDLSPYEKALANFADRVDIIVGLEVGDKMSPEAAYQEIKKLFKEIKRLRKQEKTTWED